MNARSAEQQLRLYRPDRPNDPKIEKAARFAESDPVLRSALDEQIRLDRRISEVIRTVQPPADLRKRLSALCECGHEDKKYPRRGQFMLSAVLAVVIGLISIVAFLVYTEVEQRARFPGRDAAERMISNANYMTGAELEPLSNSAGLLQDWFYMRGFDNYALPKEIAGLPAVGCRIYRQDGKPVAQVAVDRHQSLVYVYRAEDFHAEEAPDQEWKPFQYEGWAAAFRRQGPMCILVTFRGTKGEMREFLQSLQHP